MDPGDQPGISGPHKVVNAFRYNLERHRVRKLWEQNQTIGSGIMMFFDHVMWDDIRKEADEHFENTPRE